MSQTVLIVQPDAEVAQHLGQLVVAASPAASVSFVQTPEDSLAALDSYTDLDLCLCEIFFGDGDALTFLSAVRTRFRHARVIVVTNYDLENFAPYLEGLTLFQLPLDEAVFSATCQDALTTLEGSDFPPFHLGKKYPPDRWGDCYAAYDTGVKRDVFITVSRASATEQEKQWFRNSATAMARATHPNVQAVYQAGRAGDRDFFAREKWEMPDLAEMAIAGTQIDGRLAAQVVQAVGSLIIFWDASGFPHSNIGPRDVSISPQGVIKVANCVDPALPATPPGASDLTQLATALQSLLSTEEEIPPRVHALLAQLAEGPVPLAEIVGEAQAINIDLAPERQIEETTERQVARVAIRVERRRQKVSLYLMALAILLVIGFIGYVVYTKFLAPPESFGEMVAIPAGPYIYQNGPATMDHPYYIDRYEVTIGEYLEFLKAVDKAGSDKAWRDPLQKGEKDHQPLDWADHTEDGVRIAGIFSCIKDGLPYHKEYITLDFPVFNIDWYDAQAYAKWAGKRLPTEHEWEKAARGPNGFLYPWGNTLLPNANTAVKVPGGPDTSRAVIQEKVDADPLDRSPYGVYDMAGNVSEWTSDLVPSTVISAVKVAVIRGASFATKNPDHEKLTNRTTNFVPESRFFWLGFRCASDTPPPVQPK